MTTHVIDQRFTASEALVFYNEHLAHLSEEVLETGIVAEPSFEPLNYPDLYWKQLGTGDRERWSQYRVPPRPWSPDVQVEDVREPLESENEPRRKSAGRYGARCSTFNFDGS